MAHGSLSIMINVSRSHANAEEVVRIIKVSGRNNALRNISSALIWTDDFFFQVLEGPVGKLASAMTVMAQDPRHIDLKIVLQNRIIEPRYQLSSLTYAYRPDRNSIISSFHSNPSSQAALAISDGLIFAMQNKNV